MMSSPVTWEQEATDLWKAELMQTPPFVHCVREWAFFVSSIGIRYELLTGYKKPIQ